MSMEMWEYTPDIFRKMSKEEVFWYRVWEWMVHGSL